MIRNERWRQAVKNLKLDGLTSHQLRNYRVCQLHFPESDYTTTSIRKRLNDDAVPQLMLNLIDSTSTSPSTSTSGDIISIAEDESMQEDCTLEDTFNEFIDL